MPLEYRIDHERRIVLAQARGTLTDRDVFDYQREVWSRPELAGYHEIVDMTDVEHIDLPSPERMMDLATLSAAMDPRHASSKFAIVAAEKLAFGLAREYQVYRELDERSTRKVAVFRTLEGALEWLGGEGPAAERAPLLKAPHPGQP